MKECLKRRNPSVECLRVLIMYFIVLHHSIVSGMGMFDYLNSGIFTVGIEK